MQGRARVVGAVGRVHVLTAGVREHEHGAAHVLACDGVDELLRDGNVRVVQGRDEALVCVLRADPAVDLIPDKDETIHDSNTKVAEM